MSKDFREILTELIKSHYYERSTQMEIVAELVKEFFKRDDEDFLEMDRYNTREAWKAAKELQLWVNEFWATHWRDDDAPQEEYSSSRSLAA